MGIAPAAAACGYVTKVTTGFVGMDVDKNPRKTLLQLYTRTLKQLKAFPPQAYYRHEVARKTAARMRVVMDRRAGHASDPDYTWMNLQLNLLNLMEKGFMVEDKMILGLKHSQPDFFPYGRFDEPTSVLKGLQGLAKTLSAKTLSCPLHPDEAEGEPSGAEEAPTAEEMEKALAWFQEHEPEAHTQEDLQKKVAEFIAVHAKLHSLAETKAVTPYTEYVAEMLVNTNKGPVECLIYDLMACNKPYLRKKRSQNQRMLFTPFPHRKAIVDEDGRCTAKRTPGHIPAFMQNEEFVELAQDELVLIPKMLEMKPWEVEKDHTLKMVDKNRLKGTTTEDLLASAGHAGLKKWTITKA